MTYLINQINSFRLYLIVEFHHHGPRKNKCHDDHVSVFYFSCE